MTVQDDRAKDRIGRRTLIGPFPFRDSLIGMTLIHVSSK